MKPSTKSACSIPDTGPREPARTLVAVRAMVPVTQKPPKSAEPTLAQPCAMSSALGRCCVPAIPSATTAERSDSMAPSSVKLTAHGSAARIASRSRAGRAGVGSIFGNSPKRVPMVSTGSFSTSTATEARTMAMRRLGSRGERRFSPSIMAMVPTATPRAAGVIVSRAAQSAATFSTSAEGSGPASVRPSSSFIWLAAMMTAIPAVKPTVTG